MPAVSPVTDTDAPGTPKPEEPRTVPVTRPVAVCDKSSRVAPANKRRKSPTHFVMNPPLSKPIYTSIVEKSGIAQSGSIGGHEGSVGSGPRRVPAEERNRGGAAGGRAPDDRCWSLLV